MAGKRAAVPVHSTEKRILEVASELLERDGPDGLSTRAVCQAAEVTAPTLYHHFGDKAGLLDALVLQGVSEFMAAKRVRASEPLADLRRGWDRWIEFAVSRPRLFRLMLERAAKEPELASEAQALMRKRVEALVSSGIFRVPEPVAVSTVQAASSGVLSLLAQGADRETVLAVSEVLFEAVVRQLRRHHGT